MNKELKEARIKSVDFAKKYLSGKKIEGFILIIEDESGVNVIPHSKNKSALLGYLMTAQINIQTSVASSQKIGQQP